MDVDQSDTVATNDIFDLKIDRELLKPDFDGYQLKLINPIAVKLLPLEEEIWHDNAKCETQWSHQHATTFATFNAIFKDIYNAETEKETAYIFHRDTNNKLTLRKHEFDRLTHVWRSSESLISNIDVDVSAESLNPSIVFASSNIAIVSNGRNTITIYDTGNRLIENPWKALSTAVMPVQPFVLQDARLSDSDATLVVMLSAIINTVLQQANSRFLTEICTVKVSIFTGETSVIKTCHTEGLLHACALLPIKNENGANDKLNMHIACLTDKPILNSRHINMKNDESTNNSNIQMETEMAKSYVWLQTEDDITVIVVTDVALVLNSTTTRINRNNQLSADNVHCTLTQNSIDLRLVLSDGEHHLLSGQLTSAIDVDASAWLVEKNDEDALIEITLTKAKHGEAWDSLLINGDIHGEEAASPQLMAQLVLFLRQQHTVENRPAQQSYNSVSQLEDVDNTNDIDLNLAVFNCDDNDAVWRSDINGRQFLFAISTLSDDDKQAQWSIGLRYDVDACIWSIGATSDGVETKHYNTIDALGYVQASKIQRKYTVTPPSCAYAAVVDVNKRAYIYLKPEQLSTELKNRKTGKVVTTKAVQKLVTLDENDPIIGACAFERVLFLATAIKLYAAIIE